MFIVETKIRFFQTQQHEGTQIFCRRGWACPCPILDNSTKAHRFFAVGAGLAPALSLGDREGRPYGNGPHCPIWQRNQHFNREIRVKQFFQIIRKEEPMNHRRWHCKLGISDLPNFLYAIHQYAENVSNYLSQELSYGHKQKQLLINQNHQLESLMPEACSSLAQRNQ